MFLFPAALARRTDFLTSTALNPTAYGPSDYGNVQSVQADLPGPAIRRPLITTAAVASLATALSVGVVQTTSGLAWADDFVVDTPTTDTNGHAANLIDGDDSLTITETGSITVTGVIGVLAAGSDNLVVNNGQITSTGDAARGIFAGHDAVITNNGSIVTNGNLAEGIRTVQYSLITNTGSIQTLGERSDGIYAANYSHITNSGTISTRRNFSDGIRSNNDSYLNNDGSIRTQGDDSDGIAANRYNSITNSGTIGTIGERADGIATGYYNAVINSGMIVTTGYRAHGGFFGGDNIVLNSGSISTSGNESDGFNIYNGNNIMANTGSIVVTGIDSMGFWVNAPSDNNTILNDGLVISAQSNAIQINNTGTSNHAVYLAAPSFIGGGLELDTSNSGGTTLNITTGPSHSVLWDFDPADLAGGAPIVSGPVHTFFNDTTGLFATFDPSQLAANVEMLVDRSALVASTMRQGLSSNGALTKAGWINVIGSLSEYEGGNATLDRDIAFGGVAGGFEVDLSSSTRLGFVGGYLAGSAEAESRWADAFETDEQGVFAGVFGQHQLNGTMFLTGSFAAGATFGSETTRFVNDNLKPLGESYAESESDAIWIMKELGIGTEMDFASGWTIRPTANLRYAAEWRDGTTESGPSTAANAVIDDHMIAVGEARLEVAATRGFDLASGTHGYLTGRAGVLGRMSLGDDDVSVTLPGISPDRQDISTGYEDSVAIFGGLDTSLMLSDIATLDLSTTATLGDNFLNISGKAGLGMKF